MAVETGMGIGGFTVRLFLVLFAVLCLVPFWYVINVSFSDPLLVREGELLLYPRGLDFVAYKIVLRDVTFYRAFMVSVVRTTLGTVIGLTLQTMLAYGISRPIRGKKALTLMVVFGFLFNAGIIPTYLIVRYTGLVDSIWALVVPQGVLFWNVIILMSFFSSLPDSVIESAKIDGANDVLIFLRLVIPLSLPAVATIGLFIAVFHWNNLMDAVIYINNPRLRPMQLYLMDLVVRHQMQEMFGDDAEQNLPAISVQTAAVFAGTLPILLVYPFVQKYFIKGIMVGAVKE
jgi:putative aldouronate transport system permease protein